MTFLNHLWKEWRDHRAVAVGFAITIPLLLVVTGLALPSAVVASSIFVWVSALACWAIAVLSVVGDLVPGEARRGRMAFLRRLPRGMTVAFLAKAVAMLAFVGGFSAFGYLAANGASVGFGGGTWFPEAPDRIARMARFLWLVPVCFAMWAFVVSCWLPRGALALPATVLVLGIGLLPCYLIYRQHEGFAPSPWDVRDLLWLLTLGGLPVAWFSFARGMRLERGLWAGAWRGLLATVVLFTPAWASVAFDARAWTSLDPHRDLIEIERAYVGATGRRAFLTVRKTMIGRAPHAPGPQHALVVDLGTGAWERRGEVGDSFVPLGWPSLHSGWYEHHGGLVTVACLFDKSASRVEERRLRRGWIRYLDGVTGEPIKSGWSDMRLDEVVSRLPASVFVPPARELTVGRAGLGYQVRELDSARSGIHDPFRGRTFYGHVRSMRSVAVRPGLWLVKRRVDVRSNGPWTVPYLLFDPETGATSAVEGRPILKVWGVLEDGRVLTLDGDDVVLAHPETGARVSTGVRGASVGILGRTAAGRYVLLVAGERGYRYVRLDAATLERAEAPELADSSFLEFRLIGIDGDESLIGVWQRKQVVRTRFGAPGREVLFPR